MIHFCGYPVIDPNNNVNVKPCGKMVTPGCAFCDEHGQAFENAESRAPVSTSDKFGVADSLAMDTGHGVRGRTPLTEQEIVDRAEQRRRKWQMASAAAVAFVVTLLVGLFDPVHRFLHAHVDILAGVLAGTLLQSIGWLRDRWRWWKR